MCEAIIFRLKQWFTRGEIGSAIKIPRLGNRRLGRYCISAKEALTLAQREHFDLVISDISMPEMDGQRLTRLQRCRTSSHAANGFVWTAIISNDE